MKAPDAARAFLGIGIAFPARLDAADHLERAAYEEDVRQSVLIILGTNPGERVMRPDFGAGLNAFVFEPLNTGTLTLLRNRVFASLTDWEPRIDVDQVSAVYDAAKRGQILIDIRYRVRATNTLHNLVYPFYLQEGTPK